MTIVESLRVAIAIAIAIAILNSNLWTKPMDDYHTAEQIPKACELDKAKLVIEAVTRCGTIYPAHLRAWADSYSLGLGYPGANLPVWLRGIANALEEYLEGEANGS
jgi:hypothetical protein